MDKTESKVQFNDQIRERTLSMAVEVRNLLNQKQINAVDRPFVNQLIRSSSSVAANYRAATRGRSDAEYYSKICIVLEEADETKFWIEMLTRIQIITMEETKALRNEVDQLVRLFSSIRKKMKEKVENGKKV